MTQTPAAPAGKVAALSDLVRKNLTAFIKARGFRFVRIKQRGSTGTSVRMVRQARAGVRSFQTSGPITPPDAHRYFTIDIEARPGINHLRYALELLIREALAHGRTPVVFKPWFDPRHNLGKNLDVNWDRYLELARVAIHHRPSGAVSEVRALMPFEIAGFDRLSTLWIERDHVITERENRTFDLIVRHNKTGLDIPGIHDGPMGLPDHFIRFRPSASVLQASAAVRAKLGKYCAMHVRRDDMLEMTDQYPNLARDTQPERILETLTRSLPLGFRVYIMTNERDQHYFEPLRQRFEIFQYFDFPELKQLIDCEQPDNFLLFEIEKQLFEQADVRVHTFTHPEGSERIALTTDKGWA